MPIDTSTPRVTPTIVQGQKMAPSDISPNKGQIPGVPKNPRVIRDTKFKLLKRSIEEDAEMLGLREILLFPYKGEHVIIGGNMRYQTLKNLVTRNYFETYTADTHYLWTAEGDGFRSGARTGSRSPTGSVTTSKGGT